MTLDKEVEKLNYKTNEDFAISFWLEVPPAQPRVTGSRNHVISKQGDHYQDYLNDKTKKVEKYLEAYTGVVYPYSIEILNQTDLGNQGKLIASRYDGIKKPELQSTTDLRGAEHHITFNKTGSTLELWVDGVREATTLDSTSGKTHNDALLVLGAKGYNDNTGFSGSLDEVRFFNRGISPLEVASLSGNDYLTGSAYNTQYAGNVFYSQGQIVVTSPLPKYKNILLGSGSYDYGVSNGFDLHWRSRQTLYEHQIVCNIKADEFNLTMNPTVRVDRNEDSQLINNTFTSSDWCPYVTTVGLYNDYGQLLAVAKPAQPLVKKCDTDMSIIVRYDL